MYLCNSVFLHINNKDVQDNLPLHKYILKLLFYFDDDKIVHKIYFVKYKLYWHRDFNKDEILIVNKRNKCVMRLKFS